MVQNQDLDLTCGVIVCAAPGQKSQQAAHGEVD
jgi:hypothetical protein